MKRKESQRYSLQVDLDRMTVGELIDLLKYYPENATIDVREESVYSFIKSDQTEEYFVIQWEE